MVLKVQDAHRSSQRDNECLQIPKANALGIFCLPLWVVNEYRQKKTAAKTAVFFCNAVGERV